MEDYRARLATLSPNFFYFRYLTLTIRPTAWNPDCDEEPNSTANLTLEILVSWRTIVRLPAAAQMCAPVPRRGGGGAVCRKAGRTAAQTLLCTICEHIHAISLTMARTLLYP